MEEQGRGQEAQGIRILGKRTEENRLEDAISAQQHGDSIAVDGQGREGLQFNIWDETADTSGLRHLQHLAVA